MSKERILLGVLAAVFCTRAGVCFGATITVNWNGSGDYTTIQAAIDAALDGDTVIVDVGTYVENINFGGKNITLTSTNPDDWEVVEDTIIEGTGSGSVVTFGGTETTECELSGFTITGGYTTGNGGGVQGNDSLATISKCIITGNTSEYVGGGIQNFNGEISHCKLTGNTALGVGGGLAGCEGIINNCLITGNSAINGNGINNCDGDIVNCTVAGNTDGTEGVIRGCDGTITNCIVWGNEPDGFYNCTAEITYCCYAGATGEGNIDTDPLFIDSAGGDYHLLTWSPCVDSGTNTPVGGLSEFDLDGNARVIDGDNDSVATVDMGVYEMAPSVEACMIVSDTELVFKGFQGCENPENRTFTIRNIGIEPLDWTITEACDWLSVNPESGETTDEEDEVTVSVNITGLSVGEYSCELTISDPGASNSPQVVNVSLAIVEHLHVPDEYPTIQAAIDAAADGDIVIVDVGTYVENINFSGKNVTLTSTNPEDSSVTAATIIDGDELDTVVKFDGTESSECVLTGFTITRGGWDGETEGGGIWGNGTLATVSNCIIRNNKAYCDAAGGIYDCDGTIENCTISGNFSPCYGGGLSKCDGLINNCTISNNEGDPGGVYYCEGTISNCTITGNSAMTASAGGLFFCHGNIRNCIISDNYGNFSGGLYFCNGDITNCTIVGNRSHGTPGGLYECKGTITNCIITDNVPDLESQLTDCSVPNYSCIEDWTGGGIGNIDLDPAFAVDYHLALDSPCIDAGDPDFVPVEGEVDIDGELRVMRGRVDMGADEYAFDESLIYLSPGLLEFYSEDGSVNPGEQIFRIFSDLEVLNWIINEDCEWLSVSPESGQLNGGEDEVTVSIDTTGLGYGLHRYELLISALDALSTPKILQVLLWIGSEGDFLWVPYEYSRIQLAINAAVNGNTVMVDKGNHSGTIYFKGKNITLTSTNPEDWSVVNATVIMGGDSVVVFSGTEGSECTLTGFTIKDGYTIWGGGGIDGNGTEATISYCIIKNNYNESVGGGIDWCSGLISNCIITNNSSYQGGGLAWCDGRIKNCTILDNFVFDIEDPGSIPRGGGLSSCNGLIENCIIAGNRNCSYPNTGGGLAWCDGIIINCTIVGNYGNGDGNGLSDCEGTITNCIIADNYGDVQLTGCSTPTYSCIEGWASGGEGNINVAPEFVVDGYWDYKNWIDGDYHLRWDSPCIDAGDPGFAAGEGEVDIDGEPRVMGGRVDMGADEVGEKQADFTRDGRIDVSDMAVLSGAWGTQEGELRWYVLSDLWEDGEINLSDVAVFVEDWLWKADWFE